MENNKIFGKNIYPCALLNCREKEKKKASIVKNKGYSAYHAVSDSVPRVGDIIAFKIVEIRENYAPEVSDCKKGSCKRWHK